MIEIRAEARSTVPFERLEVIQNGRVVAEKRANGALAETILETELLVSDGGWWAARCGGDQNVLASICPQPVSAHTSPIYVRCALKPAIAQPEAVQAILDHCHRFGQMLEQFDRQGQFVSVADRQRVTGIYHEARAILQAKLGGI